MTRSNKLTYKNGFTIIELLVVIAVIGILATIVTVAYTGIQSGARDKSVLSDLDALDGIETDYGLHNNVGGKAWYSGVSGTNGVPDVNLAFTPSAGNIIDVSVNSTDYCIRIYNPGSSSYKTLGSAAIKESSSGVCNSIAPSTGVIADSPGYTNISNGGVVTTFAGSGTGGLTDGPGTLAQFNGPEGVAADSSGNVYVADTSNNNIRKITPAGVVTTLAGSTSGSGGYINNTGTAARFNNPQGVAADSSGNVYVADTSNNNIRKITPAGVVTTLAGSSSGSAGNADGTGSAALFYAPYGIAVDSSGNVYVADTYNYNIRKITPAGVVTTLAGSSSKNSGYTNATGTAALFGYPWGITVDSHGTVYVGDDGSQGIRKITPAGVVTTLAGSSSGTRGFVNGTGSAALFKWCDGIAAGPNGELYVTDWGNNMIRKVQ